jgi:RNA polymerase sigma factor (sigma-70 family)
MTNQHQVVKECLKGKSSAQKALYTHFAAQMLGVCYRYTKSVADAEDVLQEGFIKVFNYLGQFRGEGDLGAWIRRIMVTTAINYLKKNSPYQYDLSFNAEQQVFLHPVSPENPEITLNTKELVDLVRQLPPGYQTIFNLHAIEGYTHVEISAILGIHEGTSRSQYARARNLLITWLQKENESIKLAHYARL